MDNKHLIESIKLCVDKIATNNKYKRPEAILSKKIMDYVKEKKLDVDFKCQYPFKLFWKILAECNLRCKHCYFYGQDEKFNALNDLPTKRVMEIIDELAEMNVTNLILTGGEILLKKDIFEVIEKLKSKNIPISLSSNATLVTKEIAQKLGLFLHPIIDNVQVSLDGAKKETHELTRGKGTFDKTIQGIKMLVEQGIHVSINTTMTSDNIMEIPELYKLAHELKVKKVSLSKLATFGEGQIDIIPDINFVFKSLAESIQLEQSFGEPFLEILGLEVTDLANNKTAQQFLDEYLKKIKKLKNFNCSCHNDDKAYIDSQGDVYLCHIAANNSKCAFGNIKNKSFKDVWNNRNQNVLFQNRRSCKMVCQKCKYVHLCKGGCLAYAYENYGTVLAPGGNCQRGEILMQNKH